MEERVPHCDSQEDPAVAVAVAVADAPQRDARPLSYTDETDDEEELDGEFEFPFVSRDSPAGTAAPADELFADGHIRAFYPVFGGGGVHGNHYGINGNTATALSAPAAPAQVRGKLGRLFLEESRARSSSTSSTSTASSSAATDDDAGGLEGAAPDSYCLWTPGSSGSASSSPSRRQRKSGSTGSAARWRRISELVVGRSHSDGQEKFLFLPAPPPGKDDHKHRKPSAAVAAEADAHRTLCNPVPNKGGAPPGKDDHRPRKPSAAVAAEADAHRTSYNPIPNMAGGAPPRRTFLPYREELVGFFANVNGISRSHHRPF